MKSPDTLTVRVINIETVTPAIKRFTLSPAEGSELPGFSAGSHIIVHIPSKERTFRNAYSLLSSPQKRNTYQIGVRRQEQSCGGSVYMHEKVVNGDLLKISSPTNLFSLDHLATKHIFIAGGIGITPFMSHVQELSQQDDVHYELHYAYRDSEHAAFRDELAAHLDGLLHEYDSTRGHKMQLGTMLASQPLGSHVYVCGPESLITAVATTAQELGWADSHIHYEEFSAPKPGNPFKANCAKTGCVVEVPGDMSLLDALEEKGIYVPNMCRGGVCGQCETILLEGDVEHRDSYLSDNLRDCRIMPCVSRARSEHLVLDL